jgi:sodium-independent sulfate anion transporter 11
MVSIRHSSASCFIAYVERKLCFALQKPHAVCQLFATSKDVTIGPVAVLSQTVGLIIAYIDKRYPNQWSGPEIATTLSFICGFIVLGIGLLRIGWIVEFIPATAVSGYMTGSALNIASGQVPGLMGITGVK